MLNAVVVNELNYCPIFVESFLGRETHVKFDHKRIVETGVWVEHIFETYPSTVET